VVCVLPQSELQHARYRIDALSLDVATEHDRSQTSAAAFAARERQLESRDQRNAASLWTAAQHHHAHAQRRRAVVVLLRWRVWARAAAHRHTLGRFATRVVQRRLLRRFVAAWRRGVGRRHTAQRLMAKWCVGVSRASCVAIVGCDECSTRARPVVCRIHRGVARGFHHWRLQTQRVAAASQHQRLLSVTASSRALLQEAESRAASQAAAHETALLDARRDAEEARAAAARVAETARREVEDIKQRCGAVRVLLPWVSLCHALHRL
jgi:hypothetical protein